MIKIGEFTVKAMPGQPMTDDEIIKQMQIVQDHMDACEFVTEQMEIENYRQIDRKLSDLP